MPINKMTVANLDALIDERWSPTLFRNAERRDFWGVLKGPPGSGQPVIERKDLEAHGDKVWMEIIGEAQGKGVSNVTMVGSEEKFKVGQFSITVSEIKNAIGIEGMALEQIIEKGLITLIRKAMERWFGRKLSDDTFEAMLSVATPIYAGGKEAENDLDIADTFNLDDSNLLRLKLIRQGANPFVIRKTNGQDVERWGVVLDEVSASELKSTDEYQATSKVLLGETNPLLTGALMEYNGMLFYEYHGIRGKKGTPLRPETILYVDGVGGDLAADATTVKAVVTSDDKNDYTRHFKVGGGADLGYIQIDDEVISYHTPTNCTFPNCTRGALGTEAATHTEGALITQRNIGGVLGFGAEAVARAYSTRPHKLVYEEGYKDPASNYVYARGLGVRAVYGHGAIPDTDGNYPNFAVMKCYAKLGNKNV